MKSTIASGLFFTDLQFKVNRVMSLSSGMDFGILARFRWLALTADGTNLKYVV